MQDNRTEGTGGVTGAASFRTADSRGTGRLLSVDRWTPILLISAGTLVWNTDASIFSVLLPDIQKSLRLGLGTVGLLGALFSLAQLVEPAVAYVGDRVRRVTILVVEMTLLALCTALAGVAGWLRSLPLLYLSRCGMGFATSVGSTRQSILTDYYPPETRAAAFYALSFPQIIGQLVGPIVAGVIAARMGWEAPFIILAAPAFIMALVLVVTLREPPRGQYELHSGNQARPAPGFRRSVALILSRPSMRWFYGLLPVAVISLLAMNSFSPIFFRNVYGVDTEHLGIVIAASAAAEFAGLAAGAFLVVRAMRRGAKSALFVIGGMLAVQSLSLAAVPLAPVFPAALAAYLVAYGILGALLPGILSVVANVLPPYVRTFGFGLTTLTFLFAIPTLPILGLVGDHYWVRTAILVTSPASLLGILVVFMMSLCIEKDIARVSEE